MRKKGKPKESWIILPDVPDEGAGNEVEFDVVRYSEVQGEFDPGDGTVNRGAVTCPRCGTRIPAKNVRKLFRRQLEGPRKFVRAYLAAVVEGSGRKKKFRAATDRDLEFFERAREGLFERWDELVAEDLIPTEEIPEGETTRTILAKGLDRFYRLFGERQLLALVELMEATREVLRGVDEGIVEPLAIYATMAFDRVLPYVTISSRWEHTRGVASGIFSAHSYLWSWDHGEPSVPAMWEWAFSRVLDAYEDLAETLEEVKVKSRVVLGDARRLPELVDGGADLVVVDPPHHGDIQYAELSDFFYVWLKRGPVAELFPEAFSTELAPRDGEVVANRARHGDEAVERYERMLSEVLEAAGRTLRGDRLVTVLITPRDPAAELPGIAKALRGAGLHVSATWPVRTGPIVSFRRHDAATRYALILACDLKREAGEADAVRRVREAVAEAREALSERASDPSLEWVAAYRAALDAYTRYEDPGADFEDLLREAVKVLVDEVLEDLGAEGLTPRGAFYALYRYFWGYPGRTSAPSWREVELLASALDLDAEELPYLHRFGERAYLEESRDRDPRGLDPERDEVDALHADLLRGEEVRVPLADVIARIARLRYGEEDLPEEPRLVLRSR